MDCPIHTMEWFSPITTAGEFGNPSPLPHNPPVVLDGEETPNHTPMIKNHTVTYHQGKLYIFGGYDGRRNHQTLVTFDVEKKVWCYIPPSQIEGDIPSGRNGHTATLAKDKIFIIGGWLGSGPLAASDMHYLDVSNPNALVWECPPEVGDPPGPCNMHSCDYISSMNECFVFRGGNGREYLNDLHAVDVDSFVWRTVETTGSKPQRRANHSSAAIGHEIFIFGGWNGKERLNDVHILDTRASVWSSPVIAGTPPHPRAGMTLTAQRGRLFLFGGSGSSSKCFKDLQVLDRERLIWLEIMEEGGDADGTKDVPGGESGTSVGDGMSPLSDGMSSLSLSRPSSHLSRLHGNEKTDENPNSYDNTPIVKTVGIGPGRRAGHTATAVNRKIFIFGGSCGADYLSDFFELDTDPPHEVIVDRKSGGDYLLEGISQYFGEDQFHDIIFNVEGRPLKAHKIILCSASECFRAMFEGNFQESKQTEIDLPDCSYSSFRALLEYIYKGRLPPCGFLKNHNNVAGGQDGLGWGDREHAQLQQLVDLLELSDQYLLHHLKQKVEGTLRMAVSASEQSSLLVLVILFRRRDMSLTFAPS